MTPTQAWAAWRNGRIARHYKHGLRPRARVSTPIGIATVVEVHVYWVHVRLAGNAPNKPVFVFRPSDVFALAAEA